MNILVDIIHPAHVHFFRHAIKEWQGAGHTVGVTAREKDVTIELLDEFEIPYTMLSKAGKGMRGLFCELILRDIRLWKFCRKFKPDVLTGISGMFVAHVGKLMGKPSVVFDDTEHQHLAHKITWPVASAIYSPESYFKKPVKKQHLYAGCHELAYLHPNRFTPDAEVVKSLGIDPAERYCVIRFVSWGAHHDVGEHGLDDDKKLEFVRQVEKYARPLITSEGELPAEMEPYRLDIPVSKFHHVLAFASLCVAEGATVASEAALLGVPAVYTNTLRAGTLDRLENYGLINQTTDADEAIGMAVSWLEDCDGLEKARVMREEILSREIDVTDMIVEVVQRFGGEN